MENKLIIVLEDIRSALNVGAIFRTCDAINAYKLILIGITPQPPHKRIPKTALGSIESVNWEYMSSIKEVIDKYRTDYDIVGVEICKQAKNIYKTNFKNSTLLIFGNEISGLSQYALTNTDFMVKIPMFGVKESLNIATSVGIASYEIIRQWKYD